MGCKIRSDKQAHRISLGGTNYCVLFRYFLQLYDPVGDPGGTLWLYACTECMFAMKSRYKYAGCCWPREFRHLRACGQPHAASLQVAGPLVRVSWAYGQPHAALLPVVGTSVSGFVVWTATRGFLQAVGPFVRVSRGRVGSHTRLLDRKSVV